MATSQNKHYKRRMRASYATTTVSISLVLFMLGVLGFLILNAKQVADYIKENVALNVIIDDDTKESELDKITRSIDVKPFTKSSRYISKDEAAKLLTLQLGEDFVEFLGYNPLSSSIEVHIKSAWANNDSLVLIKKQLLAQNAGIKEVQYQETLVEAINQNIRKISLIIIAFSILLLLISLVLINNTIRLFVYARRFTIRTMQLVGATEGFIRRPFIRRSIWQGFFSAIIAIAMIVVMLYFVHEEVPELINLEIIELTLVLFGIVIVLGILMSWIASYFSVRKYLKINTENLYY